MEVIRNYLNHGFGIKPEILDLGEKVEAKLESAFKTAEKIAEYNQLKVLHAFQKNNVSYAHFAETSGYGYDDLGRDTLDKIYAEVFGTEDALVRQNIVSGTQAIALCLFGVLRPGDTVTAVTGKPYDTLEEVIGITGEHTGSLKDFGINYSQIDLTEKGEVDYNAILTDLHKSTKAVMIQRSKGYAWRKSLDIAEIKKIIETVKSVNQNIICIVDNCYGEFVEIQEPTEVGADLIVGSLIKNPGGSLAPSGGYIAGRADLIELISYRHTSPGLGKHIGATFGFNKLLYQGFFMAPHIVCQAVKTALFCAGMFEELGYETCPNTNHKRTDIIQAVKFNDEQKLINFCQAIQKGAPIDSFVSPVPWDMPGYSNQVIMAAGAFIQGASIELSADAPIKPPYIAYMQGGITYESGKLGILKAADSF